MADPQSAPVLPVLSARAQLASAAQQALILAGPQREPRHVAAEAVEHADALLEALCPEPLPNAGDEMVSGHGGPL
ncbi:hypothetical protein Dcar01_02805 [Deinococcus carri]|uniref:Uncharacterized protein n=1 Tax=Deinococcus carri TaxID=1211323 RepID=A0ABP9WAJ4_9DEIO